MKCVKSFSHNRVSLISFKLKSRKLFDIFWVSRKLQDFMFDFLMFYLFLKDNFFEFFKINLFRKKGKKFHKSYLSGTYR
jgi:hypothetical protein